MTQGNRETWAKVPVDMLTYVAHTCGYAAQYVYCVLRTFDDPSEPGGCYPSLAAVAERAGMPERTIRRHIRTLREAGALEVRPRYGIAGPGRMSNEYRFPQPVPRSPMSYRSHGGRQHREDTGQSVASNPTRDTGHKAASNSGDSGHAAASNFPADSGHAAAGNSGDTGHSVSCLPATLGPNYRPQSGQGTIPVPDQEQTTTSTGDSGRRAASNGRTAKVPAELEPLELYRADLKLCNRWPSLLHSWRQAYKDVDILAEVTKAHAWELANPARRKKNRARFLTGWLSRTQSRIDSEARQEARRIEAELAEMEPPELPQELIDEIELRAMEAEAQHARERNK